MKVQLTLSVLALAAIGIPVFLLIRDLIKEAFARTIIVRDEEGRELGRISADSVETRGPDPSVPLHERIRRSKHVTTRAA